jgi:5-(carboxyamino)imidazole ribonucleotide mutase
LIDINYLNPYPLIFNMAKILLIFGSKSDELVYNDIIEVLTLDKDASYEVRICSAHRTPDELDSILKNTDAKVIIAGAGLAAHLPGVIASKTTKPVIGVPVNSNYQGLDALLSIMQMPPGIPVLAVGVNKSNVAATMAVQMLKDHPSVKIIGDKEDKSVQKAMDILIQFKVKFEFGSKPGKDTINIKFIQLDEEPEENDSLTIYVPLLSKDDDSAEAAINILRNSTSGLWVGLNRGENAALAAIEILDISGTYSQALAAYRKKHAEKVKADDKAVRKK